MLFRKKQEDAIAAHIAKQTELDQSYWANVKRQFNKNKLAVWSMKVFWFIVFVAAFADFIANERPIACQVDGAVHFPVLKQYGVALGLAKWDDQFVTKRWDEHQYDWSVFPIIPYSATTMDKMNRNFKSPFDKQRAKGGKSLSWRKWHWLGTDELGRDVAAGMVAGTRIAVLVGIIAMSIASIIGILIGSLAGYFGDNRLKISLSRLFFNIIGFFAAIFYGLITRTYALTEGTFVLEIFKSLGIMLGIMLVANVLASVFKRLPFLSHRITLAMDIIVMRLIEVINSIPGLLLILSIVALTKPSIINVMVIIGLISWTGIARFIRAELLRVRSLEYVEAAQAMGFSEARIIFRHAIPNALTPVLITIAFGIASAILTEAFLSFLGIGVAAEEVTWGSLLNLARMKFQAWWLAIFPGFAIFITVTIFNLIGEGLTDALDPKLKQ